MTINVAQKTTTSKRRKTPNEALQLMTNPLRGLSAAELGRYAVVGRIDNNSNHVSPV